MSLFAFIGSYKGGPADGPGGIDVVRIGPDGGSFEKVSRIAEPDLAGYLAYGQRTRTLYAVNEQKNDGRGPVAPPAAVHAFAVDPTTGALTSKGNHVAPGPRPTFVSIDEASGALVTANHGDFDHVERVVQADDGTWQSEYVYDDGTVILYWLDEGGRIGGIRDLHVSRGAGVDPNGSPQAGGHAQASAHPHCAVIDPTGRWVLVADKGLDVLQVFRLGSNLELVNEVPFPPESGPRHVAFDATGERAYLTLEFASRLASLTFDAATGTVTVLDTVSTVANDFAGLNEPADVRVHPGGRFVYVNNRGEDSVAWFAVGDGGGLSRLGSVPLAESIHPGLAARSLAVDEGGQFLLVTDRPANLVCSFAIDAETGALAPLATVDIADPAFALLVDLPG